MSQTKQVGQDLELEVDDKYPPTSHEDTLMSFPAADAAIADA